MVALTVYLCLLQSEFWHEQVGRESRFGQRVVQMFPDLAPVVQKREVESLGCCANRNAGPNLTSSRPNLRSRKSPAQAHRRSIEQARGGEEGRRGVPTTRR